MIRTIRAEWTRLTRPRALLAAVASGAAFAVLVTTVIMLTLEATPNSTGLFTSALQAPGGATMPVTTGMAFGSVVVLAMFVAMSAGGYSRGTWRASLLHQPGRWSLATGQFLARWALLVLVCTVVMVVGWMTATLLAPGQGVDTSLWLTAEAFREAVGVFLRMIGFVAGWGLLGTLLGTLTRSVPVGLGIGLVWAGPLENVIGDDVSFAPSYFPGLLLRGVIAPMSTQVDQARIGITLLAYAVACLVVLGLVLRRRDVTA